MYAFKPRRLGLEKLEIKLTMDGAAIAMMDPAIPDVESNESPRTAEVCVDFAAGSTDSSAATGPTGTGKTLAAEVVANDLGDRMESSLPTEVADQSNPAEPPSALDPDSTSRSADDLLAVADVDAVFGHELGHTLGFRHEHLPPANRYESFTFVVQGTLELSGIHKSTDVTLKRGVIGAEAGAGIDVLIATLDDTRDNCEGAAASASYFNGRLLSAQDLTRDQDLAIGPTSVVSYCELVDLVCADEWS